MAIQRSVLATAAGIVFAFTLIPGTAMAGGSVTYQVTKRADTADGACTQLDCSLREAIIQANGSPDVDIIRVPKGTFRLTRTGTDEDMSSTGDLDIRAGVEIRGAGARKTIIDGHGIDRVIHVPAVVMNNVASTIQDVTITGGVVANAIGGGIFNNGPNMQLRLLRTTVRGNQALQGGGLANGYPGTTLGLLIERSTVSGNRAPGGQGGGIANFAPLGILNSTISGNTGTFGAGIYNSLPGTALIRWSTIAFNVAQQPGGGIYNGGSISDVSVEGSIIARNSSNFAYAKNCSGSVDSWGHNLENGTTCVFDQPTDRNKNPRIDALGNYGGPTNTHRLQATSPAINRGGDSTLSTDQRGILRPRGSSDDIGAYER